MKISQTIRSLVTVRARLLLLAAGCLCLGLTAAPAKAQGGPGGGGHPGGGGRHGGAMMGGPRLGARDQPIMQPRLPAPRMGLQLGLSGRWWDDGKVGKKLSLRDDQRRHMDDIFEANKPALQTLYTNLQREEARLASLPPGDLQDETRVFAAIDRVSQARSDLEKADAHILMQIRQQLDPGQLDQLDREIASSR